MDFGWGWRGGARFDAGGNTRLAISIGLFPLWLTLILVVLARSFFDPMLTNKVAIAGLPIGVAIFVVIGLLTIVGTLAIWRARSSLGVAVAMTLFTTPAVILVILGPAIALVMTNLST